MLVTCTLALLLPTAVAAQEDDEGYGDTILPTWDDEEESAGDEFGDTIVPSWDDEETDEDAEGEEDAEGDSEDTDPLDDEGFGGTFEPTWDDEDTEETEVLDDDTDDSDDGFGDTFEPTWDDEDSDDDWADDTDADDDAEEDYYDQMWEALDADDGAETTPPPTGELADDSGRIEGVVIDGEFDAPMTDATVTVESQASPDAAPPTTPAPDVAPSAPAISLTQRTGVDGRFAFDVPEGIYVLRLSAFGYDTAAYEVEALAGEVTDLGPLELTLDTDTVATIVVEARAERGTDATQLMRRRESAAVVDGLSSESISRAADGSAGEAARRVVSATIEGGQFLFVRGLGGRYTRVLLNGVGVPATDPDFPGVQLDLFPSSLLSSLTISKSFTPDLPGDFTGGVMNISTREYPEAFELRLSVGLAGATDTVFQDWLDYDGGGLDALGFDDGTRTLPDAVPGDIRVEAGRNGLTSADVEAIGESFPNVWVTETRTALPRLSLSATAGDTIDLGARNLGYFVTAGYRYGQRSDDATLRDLRIDGDDLDIRQELRQQRGTEEASWGALGTASVDVGAAGSITLLSLWSHDAEDETRFLTGRSETDGESIRATHLQFVQRNLTFTQLLGEHRQLWRDSTLRWYASLALARRDEPDTRDLTYVDGPQGFGFRARPGSGERFFSTLDQLDLAGGLSYRLPLLSEVLDLEVGGMAQHASRDFEARRFRFSYVGDTAAARFLPAEELFSPTHIGPDLELVEVTLPEDGYTADQLLVAGYGLLDWSPVERLRLVGGARYERFGQDVQSASPFSGGQVDAGDQVSRTDSDVLPAASAVVTLGDEMFLRASYGGTVARPLVREVAPFLYQDFVRRRSVTGNPDLERTYVHNADLRWEWFPETTNVLALSLFYKAFEDPIEQVIADRQGNITYTNVDRATAFGAELEARLNLGVLADGAEAWSVGANLSVIQSTVELTDEQRRNATSSERPLAGQAPYVANLALGFAPPDSGLSVDLFYNVAGRRIEEVGSLGLPDVYTEPEHRLDLSVRYAFDDHWSARLGARNLLMQAPEQTQGDVTTQTQTPAMDIAIGLGWSY